MTDAVNMCARLDGRRRHNYTALLCVDEKSQIQALERTQPILPLKHGQAEKQSHDY
jgi:hypothetical protein